MIPSIFIHVENLSLHAPGRAPDQRTGIVIKDPPAEYSDWEKRIWRRGYSEATAPEERCEGGAADCGPVAHHDSEGVPLCDRCWKELAKDSAPKYRELGNGERITQDQMTKELAELGDGWRLETPQELFGLVDYDHKNQHDAYTRDETLRDSYYWTSQETPWYEGGRVVVSFGYGYVGNLDSYDRAFARAVRVSGQ